MTPRGSVAVTTEPRKSGIVAEPVPAANSVCAVTPATTGGGISDAVPDAARSSEGAFVSGVRMRTIALRCPVPVAVRLTWNATLPPAGMSVGPAPSTMENSGLLALTVTPLSVAPESLRMTNGRPVGSPTNTLPQSTGTLSFTNAAESPGSKTSVNSSPTTAPVCQPSDFRATVTGKSIVTVPPSRSVAVTCTIVLPKRSVAGVSRSTVPVSDAVTSPASSEVVLKVSVATRAAFVSIVWTRFTPPDV